MSEPLVSVVLPVLAPNQFLVDMARFAISTLRQHATNPIELIVVEAGTSTLRGSPGIYIDKLLRFDPPIGGVREINRGLAVASGKYVLMTGTDVLVPPGWDTELVAMFETLPFCSVASLSAKEPGFLIGPPAPLDLCVEGFFSPCMMVRKGEMLDEKYERVYQDSDLIMRVYARGERAFRSCRKHVLHFGAMTNNSIGAEHEAMHARLLARDEKLFYERWGKSPLAIFGMIRVGHQIYGREHEAFIQSIPLHHDPQAEVQS